MTLDLAASLAALARYLDRGDLPFAVIGGLAVGSYGSGRSTYDIDVVLARRHQEALIAHLEDEGFRTLHRSSGYSNHQHGTLGRIDVVWVDDETARSLFAAARPRSVLGVDVPVAAAEHLVAMKVAAYVNEPDRRLQDLADIRQLVRSVGLDQETVRRIFARYDRLEDSGDVID